MLLPLWALVRRRWPVALAGLLLAAAICVWVGAHVQPQYRATGQMMFLLPPEQPDPEDPPVNPYLNLPEGMGATANLIASMVTTDDVARSLEEQGLVAEYTVSLVPGSGPVLVFDVTAADARTALDTRDALMALVDKDLAELQTQAKTPANQVMTATRPTVSQTAETLNAPVYKALAAAGGAALVLALLLCLLVDRLTLSRAARAQRARVEATSEVVAASKERSRRWRTSRERALGTPAEPDPAKAAVADLGVAPGAASRPPSAADIADADDADGDGDGADDGDDADDGDANDADADANDADADANDANANANDANANDANANDANANDANANDANANDANANDANDADDPARTPRPNEQNGAQSRSRRRERTVRRHETARLDRGGQAARDDAPRKLAG